MKRKTKRFLASLLVVMLMMAPLSVNAYADDGETESAPQTIEQSDPAAEPALFSADEPAADTPASDIPVSDAPASDVPASDVPASDVPVSDVPAADVPAADVPAADVPVSDVPASDVPASDVPASDAPASDVPASDTPAADTGAAPANVPSEENTVTPVIKIGEAQLDGTSTDIGWNTESKSGWRYDGASVSMVNAGNADGGIEVRAENSGIDLSLAGFNRIGTLYADGNVNITGTGILLIDEIDMLSGSSLNLKTNTDVYEDGTGSVAVFLLDKDTGEYNLINGSVAGILDDEYTIPDGVKLVVPDGGTLDMRITTEVTTTTSRTPVDGSGSAVGDPIVTTVTTPGFTEDDYNNPGLFKQPSESAEIIGDTSYDVITSKSAAFFTPVLNIASNAVLHLKEGAKLLVEAFKNSIFGDHPQYGELNVSGTLQLDGDANAYSDSNDGSSNTFIVNVESGGSVTGDGTITDAAVFYNNDAGNNDTVNLSGTSYLNLYGSGIDIDSLKSSGTTSVYYTDGVTIGSVTSGSASNLTFYGKKEVSRIHISKTITGAYTVSSGYLDVGGSFANETFTDIKTNQDPIPTLNCGLAQGSIQLATDFFESYVHGSNTSAVSAALWEKGFYSGGINYNEMKSGIGNYPVFEVFTYDGQNVTLHLFSESDPAESVDKTQVFLIRGINYALIPISNIGEGITSPSTANTGSGVLGGENAGSFNGGASNSVLGGNRQPPVIDPPGEGDNTTEGGGTEGGGTEGGGTEGGGTEGGNTEGGGSEGGSTEGGNTEGGTENDSGNNSGAVSGGGNNSVGGGDAGVDASAPAGSFVVEVSEAGDGYFVSAYLDGVALDRLNGGTVHVSMKVQSGDDWIADELFAVFYGDNGELIAVKAFFDPATGMLTFESPVLGQFSLVCFHWDGTDYESEAFLSALQAHINQ